MCKQRGRCGGGWLMNCDARCKCPSNDNVRPQEEPQCNTPKISTIYNWQLSDVCKTAHTERERGGTEADRGRGQRNLLSSYASCRSHIASDILISFVFLLLLLRIHSLADVGVGSPNITICPLQAQSVYYSISCKLKAGHKGLLRIAGVVE